MNPPPDAVTLRHAALILERRARRRPVMLRVLLGLLRSVANDIEAGR